MRTVLSAMCVLCGAICLVGCRDSKSSSNPLGAEKPESERVKAGIDDAARAEKAAQERFKANIERVLQQDATTSDGVQRVAHVVERMRAIDTTGCPTDFRAAYLAHIHAWELMADVERDAIALEADSNSDGVLIESFIRGFLGDPFGKANEIQTAQTQLQRSYQSASQQIQQTFHRVEELAIRYGANLPR